MKQKNMRFINWALAYAVVALICGVLFRELGKYGFLALPDTFGRIHGHLISLGTILLLAELALNHWLKFSDEKGSDAAFWCQQAGLILSAIMMGVRGYLGTVSLDAMISGIAGVGHILLAVGLIWTLVLIRKAVIKRG